MRRLIVFTLLVAGFAAAHRAYEPYAEDRATRLAAVTRILTSPALLPAASEPALAAIPQSPATVTAAVEIADAARALPRPAPAMRVEAIDLKTSSISRPTALTPPAATPPGQPAVPAQVQMPSGTWQTAVFESVATPPVNSPLRSAEPGDASARYELVRSIQTELKRANCYGGPIDGSWGGGSKRGMQAFIERANASLPVEDPDYVLLTLIQSHATIGCGGRCPKGQSLSDGGHCVPDAILARADDPKPEVTPAAGPQTSKLAAAAEGWEPAPLERRSARPPLPGRMSVGGPMPPLGREKFEEKRGTPNALAALDAGGGDDEAFDGDAASGGSGPSVLSRSSDEVDQSAAPSNTVPDRATTTKPRVTQQPPAATQKKRNASKPSRQKTAGRSKSRYSYRHVQNLFEHPLGRM